MSKEFYDLCLKQYNEEMAEASSFYHKSSFMFVIIPLITTVYYNFVRPDIILNANEINFAIILYFAAILFTGVFLVLSLLNLVICLNPQTKYQSLNNMNAWDGWRKDYLKYLNGTIDKTDEEKQKELDAKMITNITKKLVDAQPCNAKLNESRNLAFKRSVGMSSWALVMLSFQVFMYFVLRLYSI